MHHYTYKIQFLTGHVYYGVRSCECLPDDDPYMGSPVTHREHWEKYPPIKTVLQVFETRDAAWLSEAQLIKEQWARDKANSLNAGIMGARFNNLGNPAQQNAKTYHFVNPKGKKITVYNLAKFCKDNGFNEQGMRNVAHGRRLHYKGWRIFGKDTKGKPYTGPMDSKRTCQLVSPSGDVVLVRGIKVFCKKHGLHPEDIWAVLKGKSSYHKGWRRVSPETVGVPFHFKTYKLASPSGEVVTIPCLSKFCRQEGLSRECIQRVVSGARSHHKGWKLPAS
jgi:hypothetical protein